MYFEDEEESAVVEDPEPIKTVNVIRDPNAGLRMLTSLSFAPEGGHKIAAAYSSSRFMGLREHTPKKSYVWDISKCCGGGGDGGGGGVVVVVVRLRCGVVRLSEVKLLS